MANSTPSALVRSDHAFMRQTLSTITSIVRAGQWRRGGPALQRLRDLLEFLEWFDDTCHRPKCDLLLQTLRLRSAAVKQATATRTATCEDTAHLLLSIHGQLAAVEREEPRSDSGLSVLVERYQLRLLEQLQWEESVLLRVAAAAMSERQWTQMEADFSGIASPIDGLLDGSHAWPSRHARPRARFESSGFAPDEALTLERLPLFHTAASAATLP